MEEFFTEGNKDNEGKPYLAYQPKSKLPPSQNQASFDLFSHKAAKTQRKEFFPIFQTLRLGVLSEAGVRPIPSKWANNADRTYHAEISLTISYQPKKQILRFLPFLLSIKEFFTEGNKDNEGKPLLNLVAKASRLPASINITPD
jgi:hypothetical protein